MTHLQAVLELTGFSGKMETISWSVVMVEIVLTEARATTPFLAVTATIG